MEWESLGQSPDKRVSERVYRTLHALERLSEVVSHLTKRVEDLEAASAGNVHLDLSSTTHPEDTLGANVVNKVMMGLTQDVCFMESLLDMVEERSSSRSKEKIKRNIDDEDGVAAFALEQQVPKRDQDYPFADLGKRDGTHRDTDNRFSKSQSAGSASTHGHLLGSNHVEVRIAPSMWDMPFLLGYLPSVSSVFLLCLIFLNITVQTVFTIIVYANLGVADITDDTVLEFRKWRRTIAHDAAYYNRFSQESLAHRVCTEDGSIELSGVQTSTFSSLLKYLGDGNGLPPDGLGPVMCVLALLTYILTVLTEGHDVVNTFYAIRAIPRGRHSCITLNSEGGLCIEQLGWARASFCILFLLIRLVIFLCLTFSGCFFLVHETEIGDLLLNAVALEFILGMDELIFDALAPFHVKKLVEDAQCLAVITWQRWRGVDWHSTMTILISLSILLFFFVAHLIPYVGLLVDARDALCAGDTDFIFTVDGLGVPAWTYPSNVDTQSLAKRNFPDGRSSVGSSYILSQDLKEKSTYADQVVDRLLQQNGRDHFQEDCTEATCYFTNELGYQESREDAPGCCLAQKVRIPLVEGGKFSILRKSEETTEDAVSLWNPSCYDSLDLPGGYTPMLKNSWSDLMDKEPCGGYCPLNRPLCLDGICVSPQCSHIKPYCHDNALTGVRARQLCPLTCGCADPLAPLALAQPASGCGYSCTSLGAYLEKRRALPCEDKPKDDPAFVALLDDLDKVRHSWPGDWAVSMGIYVGMLREFGCSYLWYEGGPTGPYAYPPYIFNINPCVEGGTYYPIKPLSYICPVACACRSGDPHCPDSCPERNISEPVCPQHMKIGNFPLGTCPMNNQGR